MSDFMLIYGSTLSRFVISC